MTLQRFNISPVLIRTVVKHYLNRVLPPASPKMTGVCGGTWKYPFPFWTLVSCSPFTVGTRTQSYCKTHWMRLWKPNALWQQQEMMWCVQPWFGFIMIWQFTTSLPWFTSFSSSSMGLMRVLGQNSSRAWSSSPPRFTAGMMKLAC